MALTINTNVSSLTAQKNLNRTQLSLEKSLQRLSSGLRINSAKDDAAGLAITDRMTSQIRGLGQAMRNANDGVSIAQTAEGALEEMTNALQRIRDLAVQSANDTNSAQDRASLQKEVSQLQQEITRIAAQTEFNGKKVLDGSFTSQKFQIGANADQTIGFSISNAQADSIGIKAANPNFNESSVGGSVEATVGTQNAVAADTLAFAGPLGNYTGLAVTAGDSARDIAAAVNAVADETGIQATAVTKAAITSTVTSGFISFDLYGSNTDTSNPVTITANLDSTEELGSLADAINAKTAKTGITAELSADKKTVTLVNSEGYDIHLEAVTDSEDFSLTGLDASGGEGTAANVIGGNVAFVGGSVNFSSSGNFLVTATTNDNLFADSSIASQLSSVADIDISSQSGANDAMKSVDGALGIIDGLRADLGAIQNRFTSAVNNMQTVSENLSASRSRVQDADFAEETANMTKAQIMQQAGVAMVAQSNQLAQTVLSLLK